MAAQPALPGAPARRRRVRVSRKVALTASALAVAALAAPIATVQIIGSGKVYSAQDAPNRSVALVLGAGLKPDGTPSVFLARRLDAARALYERGAVQAILVSGDNAQADYDEPTAMYDWLIDAGIPAERVVRDYAGFDTQDYHLPRAVFSCTAAGLDVVGVAVSSASVERSKAVKYRVREALASVKSAWDALIQRKPVHGGSETSIQEIVDNAPPR